MAQRTEIVTPPSVEPVTLAEAKLHLRVSITDDDALISSLITAARSVCETRLRRALCTQTIDCFFDNFPWGGGYYNRMIRQMGPSPYWLPTSTGILDLPRPPIQSVVGLYYLDFNGSYQTIDTSYYTYSVGTPGRIQPVYGKVWPIARPTIDAVRVRLVVGYGDPSAVPETIKAARKLMIGNWYENREEVNIGNMTSLIPNTVDVLLSAEDWGGYS